MELILQGIQKRFGEKEVLRDVSFCASGGKASGLLGRNGAGKTTTLRILMDVFPAGAGNVLFDGVPIDYEIVEIGYLREERGLYPNQQKIQLIIALSYDPQIVILDEPFSGLDPVNAMLLKDVVKEQIAKGKIVLFSSHQMSYIEEFCDHIAILNGGKVVLSGDLCEIKRNYVRDRLVVRSENKEQIQADFGSRCKETEDGSLLIQLEAASEKSRVMRCLAENYDMDEIRVFEPSLNDIFVEYVGDKE